MVYFLIFGKGNLLYICVVVYSGEAEKIGGKCISHTGSQSCQKRDEQLLVERKCRVGNVCSIFVIWCWFILDYYRLSWQTCTIRHGAYNVYNRGTGIYLNWKHKFHTSHDLSVTIAISVQNGGMVMHRLWWPQFTLWKIPTSMHRCIHKCVQASTQ